MWRDRYSEYCILWRFIQYFWRIPPRQLPLIEVMGIHSGGLPLPDVQGIGLRKDPLRSCCIPFTRRGQRFFPFWPIGRRPWNSFAFNGSCNDCPIIARAPGPKLSRRGCEGFYWSVSPDKKILLLCALCLPRHSFSDGWRLCGESQQGQPSGRNYQKHWPGKPFLKKHKKSLCQKGGQNW